MGLSGEPQLPGSLFRCLLLIPVGLEDTTVLFAGAFLQVSSIQMPGRMFTPGVLWLSHSLLLLLASSFSACLWENIPGFQALALWCSCSFPFCFAVVTVQFREGALMENPCRVLGQFCRTLIS